jgi:predicted RNA-binding Zn ribbon-like protein
LTGYVNTIYALAMPRFGFHRGSLALDFAGTVGRRDSTPVERLPDRSALAAWLREASLVPAGTAVHAEDLGAAHTLREAIARAGRSIADGGTPDPADVAAINETAARAAAAPALDPETLRMRWPASNAVAAALSRIASDAIDVFALRREQLIRCELPGCGALLLSHSRGPRRRWCSMNTCGNVAKAGAHRARRRHAGVAAT